MSQSPAIQKSGKIEIIEGKKYYLHSVEKGQTLYSISKAYETTVDIILSNNNEAVDGLKAGMTLKIPFIEKTGAKIEEKKVHEKRTHLDPRFLKPITLPDQKRDTSRLTADSLEVDESTRIALFLPLALNALDRIDPGKIGRGNAELPEDLRISLEFYEGMRMAFDSLRAKGFIGKLHVYDTALDSANFSKLLKKPELKQMDLFIGPLYGKRFDAVQQMAKENNISIVSPTLQSNNILLGNPDVSKVTPSFVTQTEILAKYIADKYPNANIVLFNSANSKDKPYLNTFKRAANPILKNAKADSVKEMTFTTLKNFIVRAVTIPQKAPKGVVLKPIVDPAQTRPNIVIILSTNTSFVTEAVNKLFLHKQETNDSIIVFGLSNFMDIESLDYNYLQTLHTHVAAYNFLDYSHEATKKFIQSYREIYSTEPSQFVFLGFDIGYYYMGNMHSHGSHRNKRLPERPGKGIMIEFNFTLPEEGNGYENRGVGILKMNNYSWIRVK